MLQRELDKARADLAALVQAILNPEVTRNQLIVAVAVASETLAKQRRGEVEPNGTIVLSASEISDDWRPEPKSGERVAVVNPPQWSPAAHGPREGHGPDDRRRRT